MTEIIREIQVHAIRTAALTLSIGERSLKATGGSGRRGRTVICCGMRRRMKRTTGSCTRRI